MQQNIFCTQLTWFLLSGVRVEAFHILFGDSQPAVHIWDWFSTRSTGTAWSFDFWRVWPFSQPLPHIWGYFQWLKWQKKKKSHGIYSTSATSVYAHPLLKADRFSGFIFSLACSFKSFILRFPGNFCNTIEPDFISVLAINLTFHVFKLCSDKNLSYPMACCFPVVAVESVNIQQEGKFHDLLSTILFR